MGLRAKWLVGWSAGGPGGGQGLVRAGGRWTSAEAAVASPVPGLVIPRKTVFFSKRDSLRRTLIQRDDRLEGSGSRRWISLQLSLYDGIIASYLTQGGSQGRERNV